MSNHLNGLSNTKLYRKHRSMIERCNNSNHKSYSDYGGRGIRVCGEWQGEKGFLNFYDWSMKNGYKEGLTIERKDVNGDYCPENCCFVTNAEQQRNKRNNVVLIKDGNEILESDLARELGVSETTIRARIVHGKDVFAPKFKRTKEVIRDDGVIYSSIREAAKMNGIHESKVGAVCRGERNKTAGHSFKFKEEAEAALEKLKGEEYE
jgi:plasmid maintenance system antidote protein VapI